MRNINGYRDYYDKDLDYLIEEEAKFINNLRVCTRIAKQRRRMYANLFNRDMRKKLLNKESVCAICGTTENLTIDHIVPVKDGGINDISNIQILCGRCNTLKDR